MSDLFDFAGGMMDDPTLTPIPGAEIRFDVDGNPIVNVATCGHCGRSWNDAAVSSITPAPSGRCPFEYEHEYPDDDEAGFTLATPANMQAYADSNPPRVLPNGATVYPPQCVAYSPATGEEYAASAGDYFGLPDDEPLTDSEGEPMILVHKRTVYVDVNTGEEL